jgi:hypothetical protein
VLIVMGTVVHGILIEGTMEIVSKVALCALLVVAASKVMVDRLRRKRATSRDESLAQQ